MNMVEAILLAGAVLWGIAVVWRVTRPARPRRRQGDDGFALADGWPSSDDSCGDGGGDGGGD